MATKIDAARLRLERKKRAWTQQHLAEVSGLGIRTIQRIEKAESASPESVQAIASCLDLNASDLIVFSPERSATRPWRMIRWPAIAIAALSLVVFILVVPARFASAKEVTLKLNTVVSVEDDRHEHIGEMVLDDGEEAEYQMKRVFKVLVKPTILDDSRVLVALKIFAFIDGQYVLTSEPALTTMTERAAVFRVGLSEEIGSRISVSVVPVF